MTPKWPPDWWHHIQQALRGCAPSSWSWWSWGIPVAVQAAARPARGDLRLEYRLRSLAFLGLMVGLVFVVSGTAAAAQDQQAEDNVVVTVKHVTGQLSVIRPRYIAVEYMQDDEKHMGYEMVLPIDDELRLDNKRSLDELHIGDTVKVTYEERTWTTDKGFERTARRAQAIRFVSSAKTGLRSGQ